MARLVLASSSPRRRDILTQIGLSFDVVVPNIDETPHPAVAPKQLAVDLSRQKAVAAADTLPANEDSADSPVILAADTVVSFDGMVLGKPKDRRQAREFLARLSGATHSVHTGVSLWIRGEVVSQSDSTEVVFARVSSEEIDWYLDTDEWRGVAGGYRIQGRGACLVESITGSYSNVVGLPIRLVYSILTANGFYFS